MAAGFMGMSECPWATEHTGGDPSGAAYAPACDPGKHWTFQ